MKLDAQIKKAIVIQNDQGNYYNSSLNEFGLLLTATLYLDKADMMKRLEKLPVGRYIPTVVYVKQTLEKK